MSHPRRLARALALLASATAITVFTTSTAAAAPIAARSNGAQTETIELAAKGSTGGISPMALPSACVGRTHDPHLSYSFASVHGDTSCPYIVPMVVSINLLRWRWYGLQQLANGYRSGTTSYVNGNAKWYCSGVGTYTYRGESYHRATVGGTNYVGYTANENRFGC
jgi:hypothetical protein